MPQDKASNADYQKLMENPAFLEVLQWLEAQFEQPYLKPELPTKLSLNFGEVQAVRAAQYSVVRAIKTRLDKRLPQD